MKNPNLLFPFVQKQINNPPHWGDERLLSWDDAFPQECQQFVTQHYWTAEASVNVFNVVGTEHWDYQGKTWLEFLQGGRCMPLNLQCLETNPNYYLSLTQRNPQIYYKTVDGVRFYVGSDGNHRTCLARFLLAEQAKAHIHCVTVDHYKVDWAFYNVYQQLKAIIVENRLPYTLDVRNTPNGREDTAGWKIDNFHVVIILTNLETYESCSLDLFQALEKKDTLLRTSTAQQLKRQQASKTLWRRILNR